MSVQNSIFAVIVIIILLAALEIHLEELFLIVDCLIVMVFLLSMVFITRALKNCTPSPPSKRVRVMLAAGSGYCL